MVAAAAQARVALLVGEPFGAFGSFNPTGHASIYIARLCAESPQRLRLCGPGEHGVIVSRYHKVGGYDWLAMPVIPYLYAVETPGEIPASADLSEVAALRDAYRRKHLMALVPDAPGGKTPEGNWIQLAGAAYDRTIYGFAFETTLEQDEALMRRLNEASNRSRFNLLYRNCADFARSIVNYYLPGAIRRSLVADAGISTPKHAAKSLVALDRRRPEIGLSRFRIDQVPGTAASTRLRGVAESLVWSKKYSVPLILLQPWVAATAAAAWITSGRFDLRRDVRETCGGLATESCLAGSQAPAGGRTQTASY